MTTAAFLLILAAALFHASWNFFLKTSTHKTAFMWGFNAVSFTLFIIPSTIVAIVTGPGLTGVGFAFASAGLHGTYGLALSRAYQLGDLSSAYPVARGMGVALIPIAAVLFLDERISVAAGFGIALIVVGIIAVQVEVRSLAGMVQTLRDLARPATRMALVTGVFIAAYSVWDKAALDHIEPLPLHQITMIGYLALLAPSALGNGAAALREEWSRRWWAIVAAGIASPAAYVLVLTALTTSRVSYVGPAREIAIVLGAILGVLLLREGFGASRIGGAVLIVAGGLTLGLAP